MWPKATNTDISRNHHFAINRMTTNPAMSQSILFGKRIRLKPDDKKCTDPAFGLNMHAANVFFQPCHGYQWDPCLQVD